MKHLILLIVLVVTTTSFAFGQTKDNKAGSKSMNHVRATEGNTVWVVVNHVKPDKREQFEKFVDMFWSQSEKLSASDQQAFKQTRVLKPVKPDKEGNYVYLFIMDPVIPSMDYSILNFLKKMYGDERANEYMKMFSESLAKPYLQYTAVQSRW